MKKKADGVTGNHSVCFLMGDEELKELFTFENLREYVNLNPEDIAMDMLCFDSACERIESYIGYKLTENFKEEIQTVKDNRIVLGYKNPTKIIHIKDLNTRSCVKKFVFDRKNRSVYFVDFTIENHSLFVKYKSGFTNETLPQDLKLAAVKMFGVTKNEMVKIQNGESESDVSIPDGVKEILNEYKKARL